MKTEHKHDYLKLKQICIRLCMPGGTADMQQVMYDVMEYAEHINAEQESDAINEAMKQSDVSLLPWNS